MFTWILFFTLLRTVAADSGSTPEALAIINKHIEVAGGLLAHQELQTVSRSGRIHFFNLNQKYSYNTYIMYPNMLREELRNEKEIFVSRGTNGKDFWSWNGNNYSLIEDSKLIEQMKETARFANRDILTLENELGPLKVVSTPKWAGESTCLMGAKSDTLVCFDKKSGLLSAKGTEEECRRFSNWTMSGAVSIPFSLTHYLNGQKVYQIVLNQAQVNQKIDPNLFERPTK